jgi:hypothetical protein
MPRHSRWALIGLGATAPFLENRRGVVVLCDITCGRSAGACFADFGSYAAIKITIVGRNPDNAPLLDSYHSFGAIVFTAA